MRPFCHEQQVTIEGETLTLTMDFAALDAIESYLDRSFNDVLTEVAGGNPKLSVMGPVLWGLLRQHHPSVSLDEAASLMFGETGVSVGLALNKLIGAAFPPAEKKANGKNPPKPRGTSKPSSSHGASKTD